jgi:hypothetical protein
MPAAAGLKARARSVAGRLHKSALRRDAILAAALEEFSARGYAAARLEDMRSGPGSARAPSICISATRRRCSRNW